jgi:uncharacterized protein YndB with AHSA1/START domain
MATPRRVTFSTLIRNTPPERVYQAITTAPGLDGWFTTGAAVDPRPGGSIRFRWKDWGPTGYHGENGGPVVEAVPPSRFVFRWLVDSGRHETTVEISIEPRNQDTLVSLVEGTYTDDEAGLEDMLRRASGWGCVLTLLKFHLQHGVTY